MKKLVQINVVCNGSTGKIMCDIAKDAEEKGYETYCFFGRGKENDSIKCCKIESSLSILLHAFIARIGFNGHGSYFVTKKIVRKLKKINPDVIHLHNVHGYYLNLKVLFKYLKNDYKGKIIWTLHDCWAFTGHCAYFTMVKCNKWKTQCHNCPQLNSYPKEIFDTTEREYKLKKELFTNLPNLTIVAPSMWLRNLIKKSFLSNYPVKVVNNGINLDIFKPTYDDYIYDKYNIPRNKKIILGVANIWEERKGISDFFELNNYLNLLEYQIVLVGVSKKNISNIPQNIVCVERTDDAYDLAKIYTISTVLFNPTYEDNYPTVNLESIACNTKVITYDTGGCKEQIELFDYGYIVEKKDFNTIVRIIENLKKSKNDKNMSYDINQMVKKYINFY